MVQPSGVPGNLSRYTIPDLSDDAALTRLVTWSPGEVRFVALGPGDDVIHEFVYTGDPEMDHFVPTAGRAAFRFNLWLNDAVAGPADGQPLEVIVTDFTFSSCDPRSCPWDLDGDCVVGIQDFLRLLGDWGDPYDIGDFLALLGAWGPCP